MIVYSVVLMMCLSSDICDEYVVDTRPTMEECVKALADVEITPSVVLVSCEKTLITKGS